MAPTLRKRVKQWTQIPDLWKNAWLALVPKIPRPVSPKNLRPIGLTESTGRAYASVLQAQLRPICVPAWSECRANYSSCCHALQARAEEMFLLQPNGGRPARPATQRYAGIQLSLDLSSAFDLMDWRLLNQILSWHIETAYVIT